MFVVVISMRDYFCSSQQYLSVIGCFQVRNFNFCYPTMEKRSLKFYDLRRKLDHGLWRILFRKVLNVNCAACLDESAYTCKYMGLSRGGWGGGELVSFSWARNCHSASLHPENCWGNLTNCGRVT